MSDSHVAPLDSAELSPRWHLDFAQACRAQGDELGALAHLIAAQTLEAQASGSPDYNILNLCNVATGYFMKGDHEAAAYWYRLILALDASVAVAYQNLAVIYLRAGQTEAGELCRERAYQLQRVFIEPVSHPRRNLLILCAGKTDGNVPYETLLSGATSTRIKYVIDCASVEEDPSLPPYDLVFNAIGDADIAIPLFARLAQFAAQCRKPLLNRPEAVARTRRHLLPTLLAGIDDVVTAPCWYFEQAPASADNAQGQWQAAAMAFPLLVRPAATHGGEGMLLCASVDELQRAFTCMDGPGYLTGYIDYRSADGLYRKYRIIFVDRKPFPYHLAISPHWMVHYQTADMPDHAWKLDEERRFLADPQRVLGHRAMAVLANIATRLDLDYAGIDFTMLPDGRILVFEANATMLVHRERLNGELAHKNAYVQRIADAFDQMLAARTHP